MQEQEMDPEASELISPEVTLNNKQIQTELEDIVNKSTPQAGTTEYVRSYLNSELGGHLAIVLHRGMLFSRDQFDLHDVAQNIVEHPEYLTSDDIRNAHRLATAWLKLQSGDKQPLAQLLDEECATQETILELSDYRQKFNACTAALAIPELIQHHDGFKAIVDDLKEKNLEPLNNLGILEQAINYLNAMDTTQVFDPQK